MILFAHFVVLKVLFSKQNEVFKHIGNISCGLNINHHIEVINIEILPSYSDRQIPNCVGSCSDGL